jgi:glycosyltransferase involved in cell wall biosynthesis
MTDTNALSVVLDASAIPPQFGGAGTYVRELLRALPSAGVAAEVVVRTADDRPWTGAVSLHRIAPSSRPQRLLWEQTSAMRDTFERLQLNDRPLPSVFHSPHYTMPSRLFGKSWTPARVVTIHDLTFFSRPNDHDRVKRELFSRAIRRAARSSDALIAVSARTADELERYVDVRVPVHVIEHGIDHDRFRPTGAADNDRELLASIGIDRDFIAHVGTIEPRKNVEGLLRAYHLLVTQRPHRDVPALVLAGSSWAGMDARLRPLIEVVEAAHRRAKVICCGIVGDELIGPIYRIARVVAYPSWAEGFGLPAIEALACGATVVSSRGSVMAELAGDAIISVDPADPRSIAEGLQDGLDELRTDERKNVAIAAASRFRWDKSAAAHADLYRSFSR